MWQCRVCILSILWALSGAAGAAVTHALTLYERAVTDEQADNMPHAVYWYQQAAKAGDVKAQMRLGKLYREGLKISRDYPQSAYYYQMAAEQGNPVAEYKVGTMYYGGQGVAQSNAEAAYWFQQAAAQKLPQALHALDVMRLNGHLPQPS